MPGEDGIAVVKGLSDVEFIVRACNSHDALVEALKALLEVVTWEADGKWAELAVTKEDVERSNAALALAQGKVTP